MDANASKETPVSIFQVEDTFMRQWWRKVSNRNVDTCLSNYTESNPRRQWA